MRRRGTVRNSGLDLLGTHVPEGLVIAVPAIIIDRTAVFDSHRHGTEPFCPRDNRSQRKIMPTVLYLADRGSSAFERDAPRSMSSVRATASPAGTTRRPEAMAVPNLPGVPLRLCDPLGLTIANGGIAGEVSENGLEQVQDYLTCSPTPDPSSSATAPTTWGCGPKSTRPAPGSSRISTEWCGRSGRAGGSQSSSTCRT